MKTNKSIKVFHCSIFLQMFLIEIQSNQNKILTLSSDHPNLSELVDENVSY